MACRRPPAQAFICTSRARKWRLPPAPSCRTRNSCLRSAVSCWSITPSIESSRRRAPSGVCFLWTKIMSALTRSPKGFPTEHPAADLFRQKRWGFGVSLAPETATTVDFPKTVAAHFRAAAPLVALLNRPLCEQRHRSRVGRCFESMRSSAQPRQIAAKVVENRQKPAKIVKNTKKTVEMPDLPLTSGGIRPHREHR